MLLGAFGLFSPPAPSLPCGVLIPRHVVERRPFGVCCGSPTCAVLHLLPDWSGRCGSLVMCAPWVGLRGQCSVPWHQSFGPVWVHHVVALVPLPVFLCTVLSTLDLGILRFQHLHRPCCTWAAITYLMRRSSSCVWTACTSLEVPVRAFMLCLGQLPITTSLRPHSAIVVLIICVESFLWTFLVHRCRPWEYAQLMAI